MGRYHSVLGKRLCSEIDEKALWPQFTHLNNGGNADYNFLGHL
jgi:hypothetical protein